VARFEDIRPEVLRAIVAVMNTSSKEQQEDDSDNSARTLDNVTDVENLLEVLDFSARLLMPWAALVSIRSAIERGAKNQTPKSQAATHQQLLLGTISRNNLLNGFEEEHEWKQLVQLAAEAVANVIEDAVHWPGFASSVSIDILQHIVHNIQEREWSGEQNISIRCNPDNIVQGPVSTTMHGFRPAVKARADGTIAVYVCMSEHTPHTLYIDGKAIAIIHVRVLGCAQKGQDKEKTLKDACISDACKVGWQEFVPACERHRFVTDKCYSPCLTICFKTKLSRLHRQCLALVSCYAARVNVEFDQTTVEDAWRYFYQSGFFDMADTLKQFICCSFARIIAMDPQFCRKLTCSELESVISEDCLDTQGHEVVVVKIVLDWARQKSSSQNHNAREYKSGGKTYRCSPGGLEVADEVRVRHDSTLASWRGADCVITSISPCTRLVHVQRIPTLHLSSEQILCISQRVHDAKPSCEGTHDEADSPSHCNDDDMLQTDTSAHDQHMCYDGEEYDVVNFEDSYGCREPETTCIERGQLYDPIETCMMRLLARIRCAYIPIEALRMKLNNDDISFAARFACYRDMVKDVAEVRMGRRCVSELGKRGAPRKGYCVFAMRDDPLNCLIRLLTHADAA
jgi:hypothetical protein